MYVFYLMVGLCSVLTHKRHGWDSQVQNVVPISQLPKHSPVLRLDLLPVPLALPTAHPCPILYIQQINIKCQWQSYGPVKHAGFPLPNLYCMLHMHTVPLSCVKQKIYIYGFFAFVVSQRLSVPFQGS